MSRFKADKLLLHPEVFKKYIKNPDKVFPVSLELSLTNRCQLFCRWCVDLGWRSVDANAEIDKDVLIKNIKILKNKGLTGVTVEGGGEPTMHSKFQEIIDELKDIGLDLGLITNGVKKVEKPEQFNWIRISLDASNGFEYQKVKGGKFFCNVLDNIEYYAEKCQLVGVGFLVCKGIGEDIVPLVRKIKGFGCKYVQFRTLTEHPELYAKHLPVPWNLVENIEGDYFKVYTHQVFHEAHSGNYGLPCYSHNLTTVFGATGEVDFCCRLRAWSIEGASIGNIYEEDIDKILKGKKWKELSDKVKDGKWTKKHCPVCRLSKYNDLRNQIVNERPNDWGFL